MKRNIVFAALTHEVTADLSRFQVTPAGKFRAKDGRPTKCANWYIDEAIAAKVIARVSARKTPQVIDYEHQTFNAEKNGKPAPAAGWYTGANMVWTPDGLFIDNPDWTDTARDHIVKREYRFISPVLAYDGNTGEILDIFNIALTNYPALDGMSEISLAAARAMLTQHYPTEDNTMDEIRKLLIKLLGLADDASDDDILAALQEIDKTYSNQTPQEGTAAAKSLQALLTGNATTIEGLNTAVAALKEKVEKAGTGGKPDPAEYVPVAQLNAVVAQVAELTKKVNGGEVDTIITAALKDGKLLPALEPWARELGGKDIAALRSYVEKAPMVDLTSQTGGKGPTGGDTHGLTSDELQVAKLSGLTPKEFADAKTLIPGNEA